MKSPLLGTVVLVALALAGCGGSEAPASTASTVQTLPPVATTGTAAAPRPDVSATSSAGAGPGVEITGAGASFPAPLYAKWSAEYNKATGQRVNYQSIGSSAGVRQIEAKTVDFGASDAPLSNEKLQQKGLVQFPMVIGGVVPVVNIPGLAPGQLRLSGHVLGEIYLGKILRWGDPAIRALNPGLDLPDAPIAPVRRADGSGTTFIFTNYLSKVNAAWRSRVGEGTAVNWPLGAGGKGNEGVAAFVKRLPHSIGYVEYAYVKQANMAYAVLQNADGQFVAPHAASFRAAAASADWSRGFDLVLTQQPGPHSWPMTGATFILMQRTPERPEQAAAALRFFHWALKNGDATAEQLHYAPIPPQVKAQVEQVWAQVRDAGGATVAFR